MQCYVSLDSLTFINLLDNMDKYVCKCVYIHTHSENVYVEREEYFFFNLKFLYSRENYLSR